MMRVLATLSLVALTFCALTWLVFPHKRSQRCAAIFFAAPERCLLRHVHCRHLTYFLCCLWVIAVFIFAGAFSQPGVVSLLSLLVCTVTDYVVALAGLSGQRNVRHAAGLERQLLHR